MALGSPADSSPGTRAVGIRGRRKWMPVDTDWEIVYSATCRVMKPMIFPSVSLLCWSLENTVPVGLTTQKEEGQAPKGRVWPSEPAAAAPQARARLPVLAGGSDARRVLPAGTVTASPAGTSAAAATAMTVATTRAMKANAVRPSR